MYASIKASMYNHHKQPHGYSLVKGVNNRDLTENLVKQISLFITMFLFKIVFNMLRDSFVLLKFKFLIKLYG